MTNTIARIKKMGKHFEILVDMDRALKFKRGDVSSIQSETDFVFEDIKKGKRASEKDLIEVFGTNDINVIASEIVNKGEVLVTQQQRDAEQEKKFKQIVDFLATKAVDPKTGLPHSSERIKNALEHANVNIKNIPIENQIKDILQEVSKILPIKLEVKKIKIHIPAIHTGKAYGVIAQYKEEENWLNDGSLEAIVSIPTGMIMGFYDKLNSITHGSAITEEIK